MYNFLESLNYDDLYEGYEDYCELAPWHDYADQILEVVIRKGVTSIGTYAFKNCTMLHSVTLPQGLTSIGEHAFNYCPALIELELPDGLENIGSYAFYECSALERLVIPGSVKTVPGHIDALNNETFDNCYNLRRVTIREGVRLIAMPFGGCFNLEEIIIPKSVENMYANAIRNTFTGHGVMPRRIYFNGTRSQWNALNVNTYIYDTVYCGERVSISTGELKILVGAAAALTARADLGNEQEEPVTWRVVNPSVATVDENGLVSGIAAGNTYVYACTSDGRSARCLVEVGSSNLSIRYTEKTITTESSFQFTATGGSSAYFWRIDNSNVAMVNSDGVVMGIALASTYFIAETATEQRPDA